MKDRIQKLQILLDEIAIEIQNQLFIESVDIDSFLNAELLLAWREAKVPESRIEQYKNFVLAKLSNENISSFNEDIASVKVLLSKLLEDIKRIPQNRKNKLETLNFSNNNLKSNEDFKQLIRQKILTTDQLIWGKFKKESFYGHLTENGFFNLDLNGKNILCSDFKYAIFFAWQKVIPNDGWGVWNTIDKNTGETKSLKYFRNKLKE